MVENKELPKWEPVKVMPVEGPGNPINQSEVEFIDEIIKWQEAHGENPKQKKAMEAVGPWLDSCMNTSDEQFDKLWSSLDINFPSLIEQLSKAKAEFREENNEDEPLYPAQEFTYVLHLLADQLKDALEKQQLVSGEGDDNLPLATILEDAVVEGRQQFDISAIKNPDLAWSKKKFLLLCQLLNRYCFTRSDQRTSIDEWGQTKYGTGSVWNPGEISLSSSSVSSLSGRAEKQIMIRQLQMIKELIQAETESEFLEGYDDKLQQILAKVLDYCYPNSREELSVDGSTSGTETYMQWTLNQVLNLVAQKDDTDLKVEVEDDSLRGKIQNLFNDSPKKVRVAIHHVVITNESGSGTADATMLRAGNTLNALGEKVASRQTSQLGQKVQGLVAKELGKEENEIEVLEDVGVVLVRHIIPVRENKVSQESEVTSSQEYESRVREVLRLAQNGGDTVGVAGVPSTKTSLEMGSPELWLQLSASYPETLQGVMVDAAQMRTDYLTPLKPEDMSGYWNHWRANLQEFLTSGDLPGDVSPMQRDVWAKVLSQHEDQKVQELVQALQGQEDLSTIQNNDIPVIDETWLQEAFSVLQQEAQDMYKKSVTVAATSSKAWAGLPWAGFNMSHKKLEEARLESLKQIQENNQKKEGTLKILEGTVEQSVPLCVMSQPLRQAWQEVGGLSNYPDLAYLLRLQSGVVNMESASFNRFDPRLRQAMMTRWSQGIQKAMLAFPYIFSLVEKNRASSQAITILTANARRYNSLTQEWVELGSVGDVGIPKAKKEVAIFHELLKHPIKTDRRWPEMEWEDLGLDQNALNALGIEAKNPSQYWLENPLESHTVAAQPVLEKNGQGVVRLPSSIAQMNRLYDALVEGCLGKVVGESVAPQKVHELFDLMMRETLSKADLETLWHQDQETTQKQNHSNQGDTIFLQTLEDEVKTQGVTLNVKELFAHKEEIVQFLQDNDIEKNFSQLVEDLVEELIKEIKGGVETLYRQSDNPNQVTAFQNSLEVAQKQNIAVIVKMQYLLKNWDFFAPYGKKILEAMK